MVADEAVVVNRMVCEDCHSVFYSAAARTLVENGERCPTCGGRLRLEPEPPRGDRVGVTTAKGGDKPAGTPPDHSRRFGRGKRGPDDPAA